MESSLCAGRVHVIAILWGFLIVQCVASRFDGHYATHMTMAEFFMILPHGPNCWMGLGAFRERVRLEGKEKTEIINNVKN